MSLYINIWALIKLVKMSIKVSKEVPINIGIMLWAAKQ